MGSLGLARALEKVGEADYIGVDVEEGILNGVSHSGLRREMNDRIKLPARIEILKATEIGYVDARECQLRISFRTICYAIWEIRHLYLRTPTA